MNIRALFVTALVPLATGLSGCLEYHTTTRVNPDGSFTRSLAIRGDSGGVHSWNFVLAVDSTWPHSFRRLEEKKWELETHRDFASTEEWNTYQASTRVRILKFHLGFEKHFSWFKNRYVFTERLESYNTFRRLPITDYLSPGELDAFFRFEVAKESYPTKGDSLALVAAENRFSEWQRRSEFESYFHELREGAQRSGAMTAAAVDSMKPKLYASYLSATDKKDGGFERLNEDRAKKWMASVAVPGWTRVVDTAKGPLATLIQESKFIDRILANTFTSTVVMPGVVTSHNARSIDGNSLTWEEYLNYAYIGDFTLRAESVDWNWWMVGLAVIIVAGGPILWVARKRVKRNRGF